jgi:hypothetical protein
MYTLHSIPHSLLPDMLYIFVKFVYIVVLLSYRVVITAKGGWGRGAEMICNTYIYTLLYLLPNNK